MKNGGESNARFSLFETNIKQILDRGYNDIIQDITRTLNGVVQSTLLNAEYTKKSIDIAVTEMKRRVDGEDRIEQTVLDTKPWMSGNIETNYNKSEPKVHSKGVINIKDTKRKQSSVARKRTLKDKLEKNCATKFPQNGKCKTPSLNSSEIYKFEKLAEEVDNHAKDLVNVNEMDDNSSNAAFDLVFPEYSDNTTLNNSARNEEHSDAIETKEYIRSDRIPGDIMYCNQCSYSTTKKRNIKAHFKATHIPGLDLQCNQCNYITRNTRNLSRHVNGVHSNDDSLKCKDCGKKFTQKVSLDAHIRIIHFNIKNFHCNDCEMRFSKKSSLLKHAERKH